MTANMWPALGILALAFSGFAIPYGFYLRGESAKTSISKPSTSIVSHGQKGGITANTVSIENVTVIQGGVKSEPKSKQVDESKVPTNRPQLNSPAMKETTIASSSSAVSSSRPVVQDSPSALLFLNPPFVSLKAALSKASERAMPVFTVIYDNDHPTHSKLTYSLGYFMEYQATKRLVDEYFVPAVVPLQQDEVQKLIPEDDPLENCRLVVIRPDGHILFSEGVYANPDEGLKRVRSIIAQRKLNGGVKKETR
jgi:hypothetical protein